MSATESSRIVIAGAGFAGIGMAMMLRRHGIESFTILERSGDVGGIWRDNVYPGCACDIPAMLYSFSFEPATNWSRIFPQRQEIWQYLRDCVDRNDLRKHIRFNAELTEARYDETSCTWRLRTSGGEELEAQFLILAMGALNRQNVPHVEGLERFAGPAFHSSQWDPSIDLRGRNVAVVGTGASAIQIVPEIAPQAARLTLYQRTPAWVIPRMDRPVGPLRRALRRYVPGFAWLERKTIYWLLELRAYGFVKDTRVLHLAERLARFHLHHQVKDAELARKLAPPYRMGCKRVLVSDDFYPALCRENVELVTEPIARIEPHAIVTSDGVERPADAIVFSTGFHASDGLGPIGIYGRGGRSLRDEWSGGMEAYLGTTISGFPNLFTIIGPNTGLGHNSMVLMMEAQYRYVLDAIELVRRRGARALEVDAASQRAFNEALERRLQGTVWNSGCASWYLNDNGRNTTLWPGFTFAYRAQTRRVREEHYRLKT
jgi:cation diffusion facilitator CzcD-associated flavoprotein CzcO